MNDSSLQESLMTAMRRRRLAGIAGLCGALLFFAGDMLFYGHAGSGAGFHQGMIATVRNAPLARLYAGGLVGPLAACLCILGFWHVFLNVRHSHARIGRVMLVAFALLMVSGSAIHALWTTKGVALKYCYGDDDVACRAVVQAVNQYWDIAYYFGAIPAYFAFILLAVLVLFRKTWYPRWAVLSNPAVLLLLSPLTDRAPAPFGAVLAGGFTNLSIALFFAVSIWTTWKHADSEPVKGTTATDSR
jgi:hypothetical protein